MKNLLVKIGGNKKPKLITLSFPEDYNLFCFVSCSKGNYFIIVKDEEFTVDKLKLYYDCGGGVFEEVLILSCNGNSTKGQIDLEVVDIDIYGIKWDLSKRECFIGVGYDDEAMLISYPTST